MVIKIIITIFTLTKNNIITELEKTIYNIAKDYITPELRDKLSKDKSLARWVQVPFMCEGVVDWLVFDKNINEFTKIKYTKGVGKGSFVDSITGYFDSAIECEFEIPS